MNYNDWLDTVPVEIADDVLWRMTVYRQALFLGELAWMDVSKLMTDRRTMRLADQLYRAVGSISANIAEGYSRVSKKDQARFYEYALGSAREARDWYYKARHILGEEVANHRFKLIVHILRQLTRMVPVQRGKSIRDETGEYKVTSAEELLNEVPLPGE